MAVGDLTYAFNAGIPGGYSAMEMRRRIALNMLSGGKNKGYPKTFGEGLGAIGDALGDMGTLRDLERMNGEEQTRRRALLAPYTGEISGSPPATAPAPYRSSDTTVSPVDASAAVAGGFRPGTPGTIGTPTPIEGGGYNELDQAANLRDQRTAYGQQLNADPAAKLKMAALMSAEEGRGAPNSLARTALAETIFNRGVSRGYGNVNQVMDPRYYQPMHDNSGNYAAHLAKVQSDPAYRTQLFSEIGNTLGGSNVSNLATDNASGAVAANSRRNTSEGWTAPNGEYFARKDIRPDVHGQGPVANTANWYARTAVGGVAPAVATSPLAHAGNTGGTMTDMVQPSGIVDPREGIARQLAPPPPATAPAPPSPPVPAPNIAPAPQQIAQVQGIPRTRPELPGAPSPPPMSKTEENARKTQMLHGDDPVVNRAMQSVIDVEQAKAKDTHARDVTLYNAKLQDALQRQKLFDESNTPEKLAEQASKRAKEPLELEELRQKVKKGQAPVLQENVRSKTIWDENSQSFIKAPTSGGAPQKGPPEVIMNNEQSNNLKYYNWTKEAEDTFEGKDKILADGYAQRAIGQIPFVGNALQEKKYRNASGAAERWVQGFMRDISGAAIGTAEFEKHMKTFFPMPGDSAQDIADKKRARENATTGMYTGTGPGREVADYYDKERSDKRAASQTEAEQKMQGVPRQAGKISNNGKGVRMRWTGSKWEEP